MKNKFFTLEFVFQMDMQACPFENYKLLITFDNKEIRIFDVEPYLNDAYFAPLRNVSIFESVKINPISLEWAGGIDMCPDELYYNSVLAQ